MKYDKLLPRKRRMKENSELVRKLAARFKLAKKLYAARKTTFYKNK